jgi:ATP-dependent Lon protease
LKLQQDCNVREISDLVKYQMEQKQQKEELKEQVKNIQDEIEQKKERLRALKE